MKWLKFCWEPHIIFGIILLSTDLSETCHYYVTRDFDEFHTSRKNRPAGEKKHLRSTFLHLRLSNYVNSDTFVSLLTVVWRHHLYRRVPGHLLIFSCSFSSLRRDNSVREKEKGSGGAIIIWTYIHFKRAVSKCSHSFIFAVAAAPQLFVHATLPRKNIFVAMLQNKDRTNMHLDTTNFLWYFRTKSQKN